MMTTYCDLWSDLNNQASSGDVVTTPCSLDGLGADKNRGNAYLNAEIMFSPAGEWSRVDERNSCRSFSSTCGKTVVHDQVTFLRSHLRIGANMTMRCEAGFDSSSPCVFPGGALLGENCLVGKGVQVDSGVRPAGRTSESAQT